MKKLFYIAVIILVFGISAAYCLQFFGGYEGVGDGNDYAGLARSLLAGKGFSLGHIYPLGLVFDTRLPQPDNVWAPGYPVYLALCFSWLGIGDKGAIWASIFSIWLLALSGFFLGRRMGGNIMGILVFAFIGLNQVILYYSIEGAPEIMAGAILTFAVLLLWGGQSLSKIIISGFLFGLAILLRYQIAIIAIPLLIIFFKGHRRNAWPWLTVAFITILPWIVRNWIVLGSPFFTLQSYGEITKGMGRFDDFYYTYRSFTPMNIFYVFTHFPLDLIKKFVAGLIFFAGAFPIRLNFLGILPFFFALMKLFSTDSPQRKAAIFAFYGIILVILVSSLDGHHDRHLLPLQTFLVVTMFVGFEIMAREFGFKKHKIAMIAIGAILFIPARAPFLEYRLAAIANQCRTNKPAYIQLSSIVEPDEVVLSDVSDAIWWYSNRLSIWVPVDYIDVKTAVTRTNCRYLYLSEPIAFLNKLNNNELSDFVNSAEQVDLFHGPGKLFKFKGNNVTASLAAKL
jgi:hypothetical protein